MEGRKRQGTKRRSTEHMRLCVKTSAEAFKYGQGKEPTVNLVRERCQTATVNPDTGEYFDKKLILDVFKNDCYDEGAQLPWGASSASRAVCALAHSSPGAIHLLEGGG